METKIEWCDYTFNPWWGCQRVSPACEHCYAETFSKRVGGSPWAKGEHWGPKGLRTITSEKMWGEPLKWNAAAAKAGVRGRVFCASMADVGEDRRDLDVPRARLRATIEATPWLDWLLLSKRPENLVRLMGWPGEWPANVWAGATVEDQKRADERIPLLLRVPAAVRFLSVEPMLGAVDLGEWIERIDHCGSCEAENPRQGPDKCPECGRGGTLISTWGHAQAKRYLAGERYDEESAAGRADVDGTSPSIGWVIVGGESGPGARPFDLAWARSIVAQCKAAGVACFVKQLGAVPETTDVDDLPMTSAGKWARGEVLTAGRTRLPLVSAKGGDPAEWPADLRVREWPDAAKETTDV